MRGRRGRILGRRPARRGDPTARIVLGEEGARGGDRMCKEASCGRKLEMTLKQPTAGERLDFFKRVSEMKSHEATRNE